ncbi:serine threonine-protein kinase plk4-like [Stylonychia lemnae]|uniref:Serine threonine-protein kinase plk4-like n=1 Tax=Stylonychia lemnae TaxID=5949 RepID=A0A078B040_STYLE|nr:serine threonine-protein kinase plk4-like [Stylonychia lemnae]|eukprot:CDW87869.1 serine threonine-protein kinase plk4-like [Stylonychia lemnae]
MKDYIILDQIGRGANATVYKVQCHQDQRVLALKVTDKEKVAKSSQNGTLNREIMIHSKLKSPHIIELYQHFEDKENLYMLMEYQDCVDLYKQLKEHKQQCGYGFDEIKVAKIMKKVAKGVKYMHDLGYIHRDLKLSNILYTKDEQVKILDFGITIHIQDLMNSPNEQCGTPNYLSPEIGLKQAYDFKTDIWSLGCILYALFTGYPPFECPDSNGTIQRIIQCKYKMPQDLTEDAQDLISKMLVKDQKKRYTIDQVLAHSYLSKDESLMESQISKTNINYEHEEPQKFETINFEKESDPDNIYSAETPAFHEYLSSKNKQKSKILELQSKQSCSKNLQYEDIEAKENNYNFKQKQMKLSKIKQKLDERVNQVTQNILQQKAYHNPLQEIQIQPTSVKHQNQNIMVSDEQYSIDHKKKQKKNYEEIKLELISTIRLQPIKHQTPNGGYIKINKKGEVVQLLHKQQKKLYISPNGQSVSIKSLALENDYEVQYRFDRLPSKLKPWYKYAMDFVKVMKSKTPKIIYANEVLKCYMMENEPLANIEIEFLTQPKEKNSVKIFSQVGSEMIELTYRDKIIKSKVQSFLINLFQNYDDLDRQQQYYVDEAHKCISLCNEVNNQCHQNSEYPIIIDERLSNQESK